MISWRYHVVSIVAVILAFGLGILAGSSVVNERFIRDLELNYDEAIDERDAAVDTVALYEEFAEGLQPILRDDVLTGEEAVVVTMEAVDRPARRAADELEAAGVDVLATLRLTRRLAEPELPENVATIQAILGTTSSDPETLRRQVADELAARLAAGPDTAGDDVLGALLAEGLVTADRDLDDAALQGIGGATQVIVLAAGGAPPVGLPGPSTLLVPLVDRFVALDATVAVVGPREDDYGSVAAVRDSGDIPDCSIVTVDDIDLPIGGIALVMGLQRLLDDPDPEFRPGGDYGIGTGAIVPGAAEVPASCRR
ncbi:MAG TPA: copper transporter [Actinomycetota bacterium]